MSDAQEIVQRLEREMADRAAETAKQGSIAPKDYTVGNTNELTGDMLDKTG